MHASNNKDPRNEVSCSKEVGHGVQAKIALVVLLPGPAQCPDGAFGKSQTRFGFVLQNKGIVDRVPCQSMQTHHFAFAVCFQWQRLRTNRRMAPCSAVMAVPLGASTFMDVVHLVNLEAR